jgi:hypothetical protein
MTRTTQYLTTLSMVFACIVVGACAAARTYSVPAMYMMMECEHDGRIVVSHWDCPTDSTRVMAADVESVELTVTTRSGRSYRKTLGRGVDAVFLSREAVEQFLIPHYERTRPSAVDSIRRAIRHW